MSIDQLRVCHVCAKNLKHCQIVFGGKNNSDTDIVVHPECIVTGADVKSVNQLQVFVEENKQVSPVQQLVLRKRLKKLHSLISEANKMRALADANNLDSVKEVKAEVTPSTPDKPQERLQEDTPQTLEIQNSASPQ